MKPLLRIPRCLFKPLAVLVSALFVSGCIILPTPHFDSGEARSNVDKKSLPQIHPGVTTREEVLLKFGEPDAISHDESQLAYRAQKIIAFWLLAGGYSAASGVIPEDQYFLVQFNKSGTVQELGKSLAPIVSLTPDALVETNGWTSRSPGPFEPGAVITGLALWYPNTHGHDEIFFDPKNRHPGFVTLTSDEIQFRNSNGLFNSEPEWTLPYNCLTNCQATTGLFNPRVLLWTRDSHIHSFSFTDWHPIRKTDAAVRLIQSKIEIQ